MIGPGTAGVFTLKNGLELKQGEITDADNGGAGFKIILGYVFISILNTSGCLIIDTPASNIGGAWVNNKGGKETYTTTLAKFLSSNYEQIIAFCLPDEVKDFGDHINPGNQNYVKNIFKWQDKYKSD